MEIRLQDDVQVSLLAVASMCIRETNASFKVGIYWNDLWKYPPDS